MMREDRWLIYAALAVAVISGVAILLLTSMAWGVA